MFTSLARPATGTICICLFFAVVMTVAGLAPKAVGPLLGIAGTLGLLVLAYRHLVGFSVAWLLLAGMSLEMTINDLAGPSTYTATIAAVKVAQLLLAALCVLRYGPLFDVCNPAGAYLVIFIVGLCHGLHPGLTVVDSVRSLAGSVAPFAFCLSRPPRVWADAIIRATCWLPVISLVGGLILYVTDQRPLFVESGGWRLAGLGHPAFLAGVCLAAVYACLIRVYRGQGRGGLILLGANLTILVLTGARAPLAYGVFVTMIAFAVIRSPNLQGRRRWLPLLCAATLLPLVGLLDHTLSGIRLFNLLASNDTTDLSGRDLLWPPFEAAAEQSYWFGWGLGAGNVIIPPESEVAQQLKTWAAHNEYLRMEVEGGQVGRALLVIAFAAWAVVRTARLPQAERHIIRLIFIAFAAHAVTDNVLISTPASVLFTFIAAVFVGGDGNGAQTWRSRLPKPATVA
jgi:hypothetical protein